MNDTVRGVLADIDRRRELRDDPETVELARAVGDVLLADERFLRRLAAALASLNY